jgi:hypothetical protein
VNLLCEWIGKWIGHVSLLCCWSDAEPFSFAGSPQFPERRWRWSLWNARLLRVAVFVGAVADLALGMASARYIESLVYQVKATDPRVLALPSLTSSAAVLTNLALLAGSSSAHRRQIDSLHSEHRASTRSMDTPAARSRSISAFNCKRS